MMVLVTYDVNTETPEGRARLRKVARLCVNHGQRVQNSVFECLVDPSQFETLKHNLISVADEEKDSIRFTDRSARPGTPIRSHPLTSDASARSAVTNWD